MKWLLNIILLFLCQAAYSQTDESKGTIGVKTSINGSLILGTELENPRPKFGYTAGIFYQHTINSTYGIHSELNGSFRGSKFKNGIGEYSKIAIFYLDLPLLLSYKPSADSKNQFVAGPYASFQALSSLFVGEQKKAAYNDLALKDFDYGLAIYYHKKQELATLQVGTKIGLRNINDGIYFENIKPETGNNGSILNLCFEIGYLF